MEQTNNETENPLWMTEDVNEKNQKAKAKNIKRFEHGVLGVKMLAVGGLAVLALKQGDTSYISKNPKNFLYECMAVGASAAIPTALIAFNRVDKTNKSYKSKILNSTIIVFMLFFIFHLLMEMSGVNNYETAETCPGDEKQQTYLKQNIMTSWFEAAIVCMGTSLLYLAFKVHETDRFTKHKMSSIIEFAVFAIANAAPCYLILKDRGHKEGTLLKSAVVGLAYGAGYVGLQAGGFFDHLFGPQSL